MIITTRPDRMGICICVLVYLYLHCSHVGPHLGTLVPMGTKMSFLVPIWSPFIFKVPIFSISDLRTRQKSVQPLSNVNH